MREVFYGYWYDGELPPYARLSIKSYVQNGHTFVLYTHGTLSKVPHGCIVADAHKYITEKEIQPFLEDNMNLRMLSDWFRYRVMYDRGGWWADADTILIPNNPIPQDDYVFFKRSGETISTCLYKVPPKSAVMAKLERCFSNVGEKRPWADSRYYTAVIEQQTKGKYLSAEIIKKGAIHMYGGPYWMFYAVQDENINSYIRVQDKDTRVESNGVIVAYKDVDKIFDGSFSYKKDIAPKGWNMHMYAFAMKKKDLWNKMTDDSVAAELIRMYGLD